MKLFYRAVTAIRHFLLRFEKPEEGLTRVQQVAALGDTWESWDMATPAPLGWYWVPDNMRNTGCLVRYCNGRLELINRREWYRARQRGIRHRNLAAREACQELDAI